MSITIVQAHDAIHASIVRLPPGQAAGYATGSPGIRWTDRDWATHPGAVRICQDATASDPTADVLDVERFAASNALAPAWYKRAAADWAAGRRPGQRHPAIYTSASNVPPLVNTLKAAGVHSGPRLWVANWNLSLAQAIADVAAASGPYPICGVQWRDGTLAQPYDSDVFSAVWLTEVSHPAGGPPYAHDFTGHETIAQATAGRHEPVKDLLAHTAAAMTVGDEVMWGRIIPSAGTRYYTVHP